MNRITIIGVGATRDQLTLGALEALKTPGQLVLRTARTAAADWLREQGIAFEALDALHEAADDFDALNDAIVRRIEALLSEGDVCYCVPDVRDRSCERLLEAHPDARVVPGVPLEAVLMGGAVSPMTILAAADADAFQPESDMCALVREIDTREAASELKLRLMERYPEELSVRFMNQNGAIKAIALCELDRQTGYGHLAAAYIPAAPELTQLERFGFDQLNRIMRVLRGPNGCPWDIKQTHQSLTTNVVEEAYEVVDAIERADTDALYDELGDLLLQVTLHAEIARQHGEFTIDDVTTAICQKMISRHAHIFGGMKADTPEQVLDIWEQQKRKEKQIQSASGSMKAVTKSLPALMRAEKVQKKAASVGFDWPEAGEALAKVDEEAEELKAAMAGDGNVEEELGDLLFAVVNVARLLKLQPELLLGAATDKFMRRFEAMESLIQRDGKSMEAMELTEMDEYWGLVKQNHVKP